MTVQLESKEQENLVTFTVFTPTFNRGDLLRRVYESLKSQTLQQFEWLIVDDGSTDNTHEIAEELQGKASFPVRYYWQPNQHKKVAFNRGVREAKGAFFLTLDSDDEILPNALEILHVTWNQIPGAQKERYAAVTGLCMSANGTIIGDVYPSDPFDSDSVESRLRYRIKGEKFGFTRTDILRKYPFPENVDGLVPEGIVWDAIARDGFRTRYINASLRIYHQSTDAVTRDPHAAFKYAEGHALLALNQLANLRWFWSSPTSFILAGARFTRFNLHLKFSRKPTPAAPQDLTSRLIVMLTLPLGGAWFVFDRIRRTRTSRARH